MKTSGAGAGISLAATDLSGFNECEHKTVLDLAVALGELKRPGDNEIERRMLERRGFEHEARVFEHLVQTRKDLVEIALGPGDSARAEAVRATRLAMERGAQLIAQGVLVNERWFGRPDFLLRVEKPSRFGAHSYVVADAKLAHEAKARAVLQLCAYSELLAEQQGAEPELLYLALGGPEVHLLALRCADYTSYYRLAKRRLEAFVAGAGTAARETYPEPVEHCGVCSWWKRCEERRRSDDHLSLVAGISARQRDRLNSAEIARVTALAALDPARRIDGIAQESLCRVREQARLQVAGRAAGKPLYELLLDAEPNFGLDRLPSPTPGDLFLDLEGDPFVQGRGLEYLFGLLCADEIEHSTSSGAARGAPRYRAYWSKTEAEEKRAFEAVIDRIVAGRAACAELHVYHFGHREADALKTLSCRHRTRESQVDQLLREHVLVDLHGIVKRSVRASVESYTLKQLEGLYDFERSAELRAAARAMQLFGWLLESGEGEAGEAELRATIERYNQDDCLSTQRLRDWLEARRGEFEGKTGRILGRPESPKPAPAEEPRSESEELARRLLERLPEDPAHDTREQAAERLLVGLLEWHWRESKQTWWEYYRALELAPKERFEDRAVLSGLRFVGIVGSEKKSSICRYEFPEQEHALKVGSQAHDPDSEKGAGEVLALGDDFVLLKRGPTMTAHPSALISGVPIPTRGHAARLLALGRELLTGGESFRAARELLLRNPPRCGQKPQSPLVLPGEDTVLAIQRLALSLDHSVLAIQGPPGSGKTHRAAEMIAALVRAGKRVGVTSNSHRVIKAVLAKAAERAPTLRILHIDDADSAEDAQAPFEFNKDYPRIRARLDARQLDVVGGTSWAWTTDRLEHSVDVLVVDEAGQMSLANVLAVSSAADSLVLFGDPAQLDQPQKGSHPPGVEASALEHLLGDALTMPADRGVFLPETRRLSPAICAFTSRVFYDGRLTPIAGLEQQRIEGPAPFRGSGLRFVPCVHRGNTNQADEEVACVYEIIATLLRHPTRFVDGKGETRALSARDILVVAPYNAQVIALRSRLGSDVQVGTVDKFQGAEAPIVVYSMTSSSAEDAPRGLEFLYSLNRLNVATSRAQALVILVANPTLSRVRCMTPRHMQLVNALCAFLELAEP
ncbi:MAG TPA: TM0106 family RecB-like putative nuclease [Polyangiaceae bacterium]|nr:TM0106 family RecB-like putative nuclease [Polyangiaceae bacterium]